MEIFSQEHFELIVRKSLPPGGQVARIYHRQN